MSKPKHFVAPDRALAIVQFGVELAALCKKYGLDICASPGGDMIEVLDLKRKGPMPPDYDYDATFKGCDPTGVYRFGNEDVPEYVPIRIEEWMPEDRPCRKGEL